MPSFALTCDMLVDPDSWNFKYCDHYVQDDCSYNWISCNSAKDDANGCWFPSAVFFYLDSMLILGVGSRDKQ